MRKSILCVSIVVVALTCGAPGGWWKIAEAQSPPASPKLNDAERALVAGSRQAIVRTGMSEGYFDRHFKLVKVINQPGDRRIIWTFSINEYSTTVNDVLGYYTAKGKRIDVHSVTATLGSTSEIKRTISRRKANQLLQRCIGRFMGPAVEFRSTPSGTATIVLTAEAVPRAMPPETKKPLENPAPEPEVQTEGDLIKKKGKKPPPIIVGAIDLQTGKCTKGQLLSGPPPPPGSF